MRNTINTLVCGLFMILSVAAFGNTNPITGVFSIDKSSFTLTVSDHDSNYFDSIEYNELSEKISFMSKATINMVKVIDVNDEVVMFLPVAGDIMHLSVEELIKGDYKVNIILDGVSDIIETSIVKK